MKVKKSYRFSEGTLLKIDELRKRKSAELDDFESVIKDREIIEKAIDYYHSQTFGDKERNRIIEMLEREIHHAINDSLKNFMGEILAMFQILNNGSYKNELYNEIILKILVQKLNVETSETARYAYTNNRMVFSEEVEKRMQKDLPSLFQYYKKINESRNKYFNDEIQNEKEIEEDKGGIIYDADNLPF